MKPRKPWGNTPRRCVHCGGVGPRVVVAGGHAHRYCLSGGKQGKYAYRSSPHQS